MSAKTGRTGMPGAAVQVLAGAGLAGAGIGVAAAVRRRRAGRRTDPSPSLREAFPEAVEVGAALRRAGLSVAVAESCTGGLLGAALTAVPGSSRYVIGGVVAYTDAVKSALLGVPSELVEAHGAVSEPVAAAMAAGARRRVGADLGVGITGVAGPGSEGSEKAVGTVFVAVSGPDSRTRVTRLDGDHGREGNRAAAVRTALHMCVEAAAAGGRR